MSQAGERKSNPKSGEQKKIMIKLTLLSPAMEVHATGCGDIARSLRNRYTKSKEQVEGSHTYEGDGWDEVIRELDTDLADWFGEKLYQENMTAWTYVTCHIAPCVKKLVPAGWKHPLLIAQGR